jgi:hypothetical protein
MTSRLKTQLAEPAEVVGPKEQLPRPRRVRHECRLDWYSEKCSITDRQHAAGLRFRRDWLIGAAPPRLVGRYTMRLPPRPDLSDGQLAARQRAARAAARLAPDLVRVVIDVCCFDAWAAERLPKLREALTCLADHYGLPKA